MDEQQQVETPVPVKPKRPYKRRSTARREPREPRVVELKVKDEFEGLTARSCCNECDGTDPKKGCVIMGNGDAYCAHPYQSGLQPIHKMNPKIIARFNRARQYLERQASDKKYA